jgi:ATP-binding cassette subfamily F protein uup
VRQRPNVLFNTESTAPAKASPSPVQTAVAAEPKRKLSYKDQRELELLPERIEKLEAEIAARADAMNEPKFYQQDSAAILAFNEASAKLQEELERAYQRWNELDA